MWFKWTNPDIDPSRSFEFLNAFELWGHILSYESEEPERLPDGSYYQVLRNQCGETIIRAQPAEPAAYGLARTLGQAA